MDKAVPAVMEEPAVRIEPGTGNRHGAVPEQHGVPEREHGIDRVRVGPHTPPPESQVRRQAAGHDLVIHIRHQPVQPPDLVKLDEKGKFLTGLAEKVQFSLVEETGITALFLLPDSEEPGLDRSLCERSRKALAGDRLLAFIGFDQAPVTGRADGAGRGAVRFEKGYAGTVPDKVQDGRGMDGMTADDQQVFHLSYRVFLDCIFFLDDQGFLG